MNIDNIYVKSFQYGQLNLDCEGLFHQKTLSVLSVVYVKSGSYTFWLEGHPERTIREGETFLAPPQKQQRLTHHNNPLTGKMEAHWIFLDVFLNQHQQLCDYVNLPLVLPKEYAPFIEAIFEGVRNPAHPCEQLSYIYRLFGFLLPRSTPKPYEKERMAFEEWITEHLSERDSLKPAVMAQAFHLSEPTLYRRFQTLFGRSPSVIIKDLRTREAARLLLMTTDTVTQIAAKTGFYDASEFSRCFKERYHLTPNEYRQNFLYKEK